MCFSMVLCVSMYACVFYVCVHDMHACMSPGPQQGCGRLCASFLPEVRSFSACVPLCLSLPEDSAGWRVLTAGAGAAARFLLPSTAL